MLSKEEIEILNTNRFHEGISIIEKHWNQDYGTLDIEGKDKRIILKLTTGGWSDNEELIDELSNTMFWSLWWNKSKRGGYYKFLYVEKMEVEKSTEKQNSTIHTHHVTITTEKLKELINEHYKWSDYTLQGKIEIVTKLAYFENDKEILEFLRYMEE